MERINGVSFDFTEPTEKLVNLFKKELEFRDNRIDRYRRALSTWDKDEEIQKERDLANDISQRSLYIMTDLEREEEEKFKKKHKEMHGCKPNLNTKYQKNIDFWYQIGGCSLGKTIKIKCPICGESRDITDISCW